MADEVARARAVVSVAESDVPDAPAGLSTVATEERRRIAEELRGTVLQTLSGLALRAEHAARVARSPARHVELPSLLAEIAAVARQCAGEARSCVTGLRPSLLNLGGLVPALTFLARRTTVETGVRVTFDAGDAAAAGALSGPAEAGLLHVARQALCNAVRHGRPRTVILELSRRPEGVPADRLRRRPGL